MATKNGTMSVPENTNEFLNLEEKHVFTVTLSVLTIFGTLTNGLVVYVIASFGRYIDVPGNMFILNQSVAHLGNTVSIIFYISHMHHWIWEVTYCLLTFTLFSSMGSLCLLNINRLVSIKYPLKYPKKMTPFRAKILIVFIWVAASVVTLLHLIGYVVHSDGNFFNYGRYYMMFLAAIFISSNIYMFFKSREQAKKLRKMSRGVLTGLQRNVKEDLKSIRTIGMVSVTFILGWLPMIILFFLYGDEKEDREFQRYASFVSKFTVINIISDPIIYYIRSPDFRMFYTNWKRKRILAWNTKTSRVSAINQGIRHRAFESTEMQI